MNGIRQLAAQLGAALKAHGLMLSTAESCTGGGVAQAITAIAGSSEWFDCGFVTYSNASKTRMLGVPPELLAKHGAVSEETAVAMAQGALKNSAAQVALATTGIAGPGGAAPGKPVGTVCFACATAGHIVSFRQHFSGDRHAVRQQATACILHQLIRFIGAHFAPATPANRSVQTDISIIDPAAQTGSGGK